MIILAAFFQLITFIISQAQIKIDEDLENNNYKIISNEIKLKDLDMHINNIIPDLLVFTINQKVNSQLYTKYYKSKIEYDASFAPIFQNLKFYFDYIKDDFFIISSKRLKIQINNIENEYNEIDKKTNLDKLIFLEKKLYPIFNQLIIFRNKVNEENKNLYLSKEIYKSISHKLNIGLVVTQILNLLFLSLFFFFVFPNSSRYNENT